VLPTFVRQALLDEPVTVYGTGEQARCFGHVADVIEGLVALVGCERAPGEIFNLGSTEEVSINDLAKKVIAASGSKSAIRHIPYSEAYGPGFEDMFRRVPDIAKARTWIGYNPTRSLDEIIDSVIEYTKFTLEQKKIVLAPLS